MENNKSLPNSTFEKNYDSEFCGSIPLHLVNLIQPHGLLLVIDKEQLRVRQVSENATSHLHTPAEALLGQPLSRFVPEEELRDLQEKLNSQQSQEKIPFSITFRTPQEEFFFTALIHPEPEYLLIELEESRQYTGGSFISFFQQIKYITSLLKQSTTTAAIAQVAAEELKRFTGFDRVLIYQFDPQWNGTVIGQAKEEDMSNYMGLRFPASDVPRQARELYLKNPYRLIPSRAYTPARLLPVINPITQRFTDLSDCNLRSVAAVHLEYLANMGIMASMSLPVIVDNRLWGLISCHHKSPKNPDYETRTAMELLSTIISGQVAAQEKETAILKRAELSSVHAQLIEQLFSSSSFIDGLLQGKTNLLKLLSLTGVAVVFEGEVRVQGKAPDQRKLKELASWLRRNSSDRIFVTNSLPHLYPSSKDYKDLASGLIAIPINKEQGEYILGFREEVLQTVNWGGNPDQAIQIEPDGKHYHPRNSFAIYQQTVQLTSLPWQEEEVMAAEALQSAVLEKIIREKY